ncbi:hypothetical protein BCR37DRAFT_411457 [Protomyces lactucae-debilis]|uniref:Uncharacterized protein n=1 Tax=Protomyces lactucae-debilis TaxID=2754530 RepID=A0A1Y2FXC0_PROLT|nr:uncharacterized protein BCR37DRAFT_411457 [Protomyces lactucae-debilis]ORY87826.1 hypothetical protein BCR37DRAFT_411457 [Protomyces lactucae-debilis]
MEDLNEVTWACKSMQLEDEAIYVEPSTTRPCGHMQSLLHCAPESRKSFDSQIFLPTPFEYIVWSRIKERTRIRIACINDRDTYQSEAYASMLIYGQTEAAAYLSDANSQISGESLEQFAGQIFATITLILAICIATDILHARIPTSKEQLLAMQSPHWVRYVLMLDSQERPTMCLVNALVSNTLIILSLFTFLINTVESARQINFPNTKRTQSMEYKVAGAFIIMITPIGPLAMFRISSTARDNTCVSGLPRDVTMPILGIIAVYHVFAVCRICWPLLRVKHQRIREWGIRSAIGVLLCTLSGTLVFFFVTMKANEYMYHTQILLIVLTCLTFVAIAAHILTWDPPYKSIVRLPRTSMDVEAQIPASKDEQPKCPSCQRSADAGTMISGQDTQTLVSKYQPSRTQSKSILDSKSVAEFLHDEEITQSPERLRIKDIPVWMKKKETSDPPAQAIVPLAVQATSNQPADFLSVVTELAPTTRPYPIAACRQD